MDNDWRDAVSEDKKLLVVEVVKREQLIASREKGAVIQIVTLPTSDDA